MASFSVVGGIVCAVLAWAAAAVVLGLAPGRPLHRRLAALLFLEGTAHAVSFAASEVGLAEATQYAFVIVHRATVLAAPLVYAMLLGTLDTPLVRPFRGPTARRVLATGAVAVFLLATLRPETIAANAGRGPASPLVYFAFSLASLYALVAALDAYRRAPRGSTARTRARTYVVAFGARDAVFTLFAIALVLEVAGVFPSDALTNGLPVVATLLFVPLLAYGIVKEHLFDIDVRVKWTLSRGTLAAIFIASFFVVTQVAEQFLSATYGALLGGVAAGLLLFAISPLQRAAERVAEAAMPRVSATPEYLAYRKLEVYRAAVESALEEGTIDAKERGILDRLRAKLGLRAEDAAAVEADVMEVFGAREGGAAVGTTT